MCAQQDVQKELIEGKCGLTRLGGIFKGVCDFSKADEALFEILSISTEVRLLVSVS